MQRFTPLFFERPSTLWVASPLSCLSNDPNDLSLRRSALFPVAALLALILSSSGLEAKSPVLPKALRKVGFDQRLDEQLPLDLKFRDEDGRSVRLSQFFGEKPVILTLAYFRCPRLCTQVLTGAANSMRETGFTLGDDFESITVSFDPTDTPRDARAKKETYMRYYGDASDSSHWHFLTGDQNAITKLTDAAGFHYTYDPDTKQFAHAAGLMILTPKGKIARYLYDVRYPGKDLRLALVEASQNQIGSPTDQVLLFCFHYDPVVGRYGAAIMNFVRLGGVLTIISLSYFFWRLCRHHPAQDVPAQVEGEPA